ncbi:MAG: hypothetical protein KBC66_00425 [Kiritimatiellae bacterium]|nr:hypothetical protein [Kiritimatiellia bacterium]NLD89974.1 hypothetical protein [Lentisphaerota bacterium]HOU21518.1 hypothetical protein [Kiritimatiellia bacterium]HPC19857.1 hypothetical protein [Kiritimatiellia bacterium]HQQ60324.1 hypothetical protein [Kiritimatiellia bacterium]
MTWDCKSALLVLIRRFLPALAALVLGVWILLRATNPIQMLVGLLFFLVAAILVAGPIARLLAEPTGNLFWPRRYYNKPQPMYGIPQSRRAKGQLEEALAEYEKIAADHPDEVRPYLEMIDVAIHDLRDADRANAIFQNGLARLKNADDKDLLAKTYAEIRTRLDTRPLHPPIALPPPHSGR